MKKKTYYTVASAVFTIIALLHLARAIYGWEAVIGGIIIPVWFSYAAVLLAGYLAVRGFQLARSNGK